MRYEFSSSNKSTLLKALVGFSNIVAYMKSLTRAKEPSNRHVEQLSSRGAHLHCVSTGTFCELWFVAAMM